MNARFLAGILCAAGLATNAAAAEPAPAKTAPVYDVKVQIYRHRNGKKEMLSMPRLRTCEGEISSIQIGGSAVLPAILAEGRHVTIPFGIVFNAQVKAIDTDRVKLEVAFETREVESATKTGVQFSKHGCDATQVAWLGTPVVMVMDGESVDAATVVEIVVGRAPPDEPPQRWSREPIP
jgi:hypothetical protein